MHSQRVDGMQSLPLLCVTGHPPPSWKLSWRQFDATRIGVFEKQSTRAKTEKSLSTCPTENFWWGGVVSDSGCVTYKGVWTLHCDFMKLLLFFLKSFSQRPQRPYFRFTFSQQCLEGERKEISKCLFRWRNICSIHLFLEFQVAFIYTKDQCVKHLFLSWFQVSAKQQRKCHAYRVFLLLFLFHLQLFQFLLFLSKKDLKYKLFWNLNILHRNLSQRAVRKHSGTNSVGATLTMFVDLSLFVGADLGVWSGGPSGVWTPRGPWAQNLLKIGVFPWKLHDFQEILGARGPGGGLAPRPPGSATGLRWHPISHFGFGWEAGGKEHHQETQGILERNLIKTTYRVDSWTFSPLRCLRFSSTQKFHETNTVLVNSQKRREVKLERPVVQAQWFLWIRSANVSPLPHH